MPQDVFCISRFSYKSFRYASSYDVTGILSLPRFGFPGVFLHMSGKHVQNIVVLDPFEYRQFPCPPWYYNILSDVPKPRESHPVGVLM